MNRLVTLALVAICLCAGAAQGAVAPVHKLTVRGQIDPAITGYLTDGIRDARREGAQAVLILLDTPGGLMTSMQEIIQVFFASELPVIVFVWPNGASASSAGAFITMAADIAAMAPVSNIGSATPVSISPMPKSPDEPKEKDESEGKTEGGAMERKIQNFAAEYAKSIAEKRGRNVEWAEKAVREAANLTSTQALKENVIDYVAPSVEDLMKKIDGKTVELATGAKVTLRTANAPIVDVPMGAWDTFLHYLSNPMVAMFLFLAAMYGLIYELANPGSVFPGVIGGISLILLLYSFSVIPVNAAGFAFIALAIIFFIAEFFVPGTGILAFGGMVSMFFGLMMLFRAAEGFMVSLWVLGAVTLITGAFFMLVVALGVRALRKPYVSGREGVVGHLGEARTDLDPTGKVFVDGSLWTATSESGAIQKGEQVEVMQMNGLRLTVRRIEDGPEVGGR